jgi:hypothetical protein
MAMAPSIILRHRGQVQCGRPRQEIIPRKSVKQFMSGWQAGASDRACVPLDCRSIAGDLHLFRSERLCAIVWYCCKMHKRITTTDRGRSRDNVPFRDVHLSIRHKTEQNRARQWGPHCCRNNATSLTVWHAVRPGCVKARVANPTILPAASACCGS